MQFDSVGFFLAAGPVILISYLFPQRIRNWFLVLLSLLFCAAFSWSSLFVLVGLILVTYGFSILLEKIIHLLSIHKANGESHIDYYI